jgi:hypothetical protein
MAKINVTLPIPSPEYNPNNQQQIVQTIDQLKDQLNYTFQEELKQELQRFTWFNMGSNC